MECIILAGGLGTRLQTTIGAYPKCMAPVNGKPFLHYLFEFLARQRCSRVILSLGYKHEVITEWLNHGQFPFTIDHVIEQESLGTGGGIQLAIRQSKTENVIVLNGDTLFQVNLKELLSFHREKAAESSLALKEMKQFSRYGSVQFDDQENIVAFEEKQYREAGYINGGVYAVNTEKFLNKNLPEKFSFEKDYLETFVDEHQFFAKVFDNYFLDIGIPEDYMQAQQDFKQMFS